MTTILRAFHGDPAIKQKYVSRLAEHRRLEHLVQGTGWATGWASNGTTKGCAVGCTLENYDHTLYPIELGLPIWLAKLEDHLFENLPIGKAEQFAVDFLEVIPIGADVEPVRHLLAILRLDKSLIRLKDNKEPYAYECRNAIGVVILWHNSQLSAESAAKSAESAAWSAWSAWSAAESAAWSAESAAWSAESAARSAESAARSAESAARSEYYKWEASMLLKLLSEAR